MKQRTRRTGGQAIVEFALILPLLAMLLVGLADFGFLFYAHVQVSNATREAARAGSLYLGGRFHYTSCLATSCPAGYGAGSNDPDTCWPLIAWVENALVERNRANNGCVASGVDTAVPHAFGLLNPTQCPSATSMNCWLLQPLTSNGVAITGLPVAGNDIRVQVLYRYNMPIIGDLAGLVANPVSITKTVIMRVQNN